MPYYAKAGLIFLPIQGLCFITLKVEQQQDVSHTNIRRRDIEIISNTPILCLLTIFIYGNIHSVNKSRLLSPGICSCRSIPDTSAPKDNRKNFSMPNLSQKLFAHPCKK